MCIEIIGPQLLEDKEEFIKHIRKYTWVVTGVQHVQGCTHLPLESWGVEVCCLFIHMAPQVLIVPAEPATKVPMEDHIKSETKSQQTLCNTLVIPPNVDFNVCKVHTKCTPKTCHMCKAHMFSTYKEVMAVQ